MQCNDIQVILLHMHKPKDFSAKRKGPKMRLSLSFSFCALRVVALIDSPPREAIVSFSIATRLLSADECGLNTKSYRVTLMPFYFLVFWGQSWAPSGEKSRRKRFVTQAQKGETWASTKNSFRCSFSRRAIEQAEWVLSPKAILNYCQGLRHGTVEFFLDFCFARQNMSSQNYQP